MSYEEQIMSKDKYPSIFSPQMEAIVFIIRAIFKIGKYLTIRPVALEGEGSNHPASRTEKAIIKLANAS